MGKMNFFFSVRDRTKAISVEEFAKHVQSMHADRDKWFEQEYNVSLRGSFEA